MKKNICNFRVLTFLFIILMSSVASHAVRRWNFNAEVGYLYTNFHNASGSYCHKDGFTIGAGVRYTTPINLSFETGISYQEKGGLLEKQIPLQDPFFKFEVIRMEYISIPILAGYEIKFNRNCSILPQIGGYLSSGLSGHGELSRFHSEDGINNIFGYGCDPFNSCTIKTPELTTNSLKMDKFDGGLMFSIAGKFKGFRLKVFYELGLHKIIDFCGSPKTNALGVSLGYEL